MTWTGGPVRRCLKHRLHAKTRFLHLHPSSLQGIADLQELLDLHRRYVQQASQDCLTWGGSEAARCAVEGALQCLLGFAFRLQVSRVLQWGSCGEVDACRLHRRAVCESCAADMTSCVFALQLAGILPTQPIGNS